MNNSSLRIVALVTTFFTGLSALLYEVTWQYYLSNLLGSQARSTAIILATFLGSLALGYHFFGVVSRRHRSVNPIRICGALEVGIGLWALLFSFLYSTLWQLRLLLQTGTSSLTTDFLFAAVRISPPAAAMGATLPLLTQGLSRNLADAPRFQLFKFACRKVDLPKQLSLDTYVLRTTWFFNFGCFLGTKEKIKLEKRISSRPLLLLLGNS